MMNRSAIRFLRYSFVGFSTFILDLLLLTFLIDVLKANYVFSAGIGFIIAVSLNYFLSRKHVFKGSARGLKSGYANFLIIALTGLAAVTIGMYVLVEKLGLNYLLARISIAVITGIWNYTLNLFVNFKVAGQPY